LNGFLKHLSLQEGQGVTWSIAVEFKFYFILPFLALMFHVVHSRTIFGTAFLFAILLTATQAVSPQHLSETNDIRLLPYMPILLTGMMLAVLQYDINAGAPYTNALKRPLKIAGYVAAIALILTTPAIISALAAPVPVDLLHKEFLLYAVLWAFVLLSAVNTSGWIQRFFSLPILRFYGALSFGLYLIHPIFIGLAEILNWNPYASAWAVLGGSTIAAYLSFRLIEGPASRFKLKRRHIERLIPFFRRT
jgi:peptidoglycan/LPS O-acetylase OafA/YrhL